MSHLLDLVCFAHLGWDFVYQRPQHLMSRCATERRVFYIEPPVFDGTVATLEVRKREGVLHVVTPHLPPELDTVPLAEALGEEGVIAALCEPLSAFLAEEGIGDFIAWYYSPMALACTRQLHPVVTIYDCMDELAAFADGPARMPALEQELLDRADLVFTGGQSLYEAKRDRHPRVYAFPSAVDVAHFSRARSGGQDPADQSPIPHPRLGYCGVLDERLDWDLISAVADLRPDWHWVMVGPVAVQKFNPDHLPRRPNIHYLGMKSYNELPSYLAGWDVATVPFARNAATRYVSPTKTPEYLAAGKEVVSTSIRDIVNPYHELGLVHIGDTPSNFIGAVESAMDEDATEHIRAADRFLASMSWDQTWAEMKRLIEDAVTAATAKN